ncbi:MAG: hypothetical protein LBE92_05440 [Chryseobacterium sp.]|jgi:hypothetical protein|uniref:hypothetical protein n=1 Tax=Chryseobacterium sp. TaxID=1871047 RepID=UPI00281C8E28|nr:hypothetical protein [Chryseobacterium sp.]MDR2235545.1 hypothetical protein [Chryseobacterium sp.]
MNSTRIIILFLIFITIYSCKNQESGLIFKQNISNEFVYITPDRYSESRDSLKIDIPLEFYIKNNSNTNYDFVETTFFIDKKYVYLGNYENIDKNTKEIRGEDWEIPKGKDNTITSRIEQLYIDMEDAKKVFKKYAVNKEIESFRDSAKIVSYKEFRKDFPEIIKKMEKVPDTIQITTRDNGKKNYEFRRFKINW